MADEGSAYNYGKERGNDIRGNFKPGTLDDRMLNFLASNAAEKYVKRQHEPEMEAVKRGYRDAFAPLLRVIDCG